jgi:hypothetical protein
MLKPAALLNGLSQFCGTEKWTRHALARNVVMTDGILYLRENADCYWLIDAIASHIATNATLQKVPYQHWMLWCFGEEANSAVLSASGSGDPIVTQKFEVTNFPLPEIRLLAVWDEGMRAFVLMLPSEY